MENLSPFLTRREWLALLSAAAAAQFVPSVAAAADNIDPQPYFAAIQRALHALEQLGSPVSAEDLQRLESLSKQNDRAAVEAAEKILDRYTLLQVATSADGFAAATRGGASPILVEQGWRVFLVRVANSVGSAEKLNIWGGAQSIVAQSTGASRTGVPDTADLSPRIEKAWLRTELYGAPPLAPALSGGVLEYRILQLFSRERGQRTAKLAFFTKIKQAEARRLGRDSRTAELTFNCLPSRDVTLAVRDADGRGCMASWTIKDKADRLYPPQAMRLAPDMQFHPQVYRADGETVRLPDGQYLIETRRGPEYLVDKQTVTIGDANERIAVQLQRWIDAAKWGWYSGDVHIHAGGCLHYEKPTEGVSPETMIRHVRGEALAIGEVLTWGPSWYYQKQFFTGRAESPQAALEHPALQAANSATLQPKPTPQDAESLLRYDVEVSGFPSSHCGHLILLRLKDQDYPGTKIIQDWPSWNLPILKWAKQQGGVVGYAHCGIGMVASTDELPNYEIPPMDGIGTQEAIVDVTHGYTDFIAGCDTIPAAELNAWYHMLNCGYRLALVGETDYPCVTGERPGVGRTYVRLEQRPTDDAGYENWVKNMQKGRLYCGDGRSHFLEFTVDGQRNGEQDVALKSAGTVKVDALVAARLEPEPLTDAELGAIAERPLNGWHLEFARIGKTREVAVELLVNGYAVEKVRLPADGTPRPIKFKTRLARSSWIALRIHPSAHTYPIFVQVAGKPVRASRRSAQWCLGSIDKLWEVKSPFIRRSERDEALQAFNHARRAYESILSECEVE